MGPDGRWITCGGREGPSLIVVSLDGKNSRTLPSPVRSPPRGFVLLWSRDASTIYVASALAEQARLDAVDVQTGKVRKIADLGQHLNFYIPIVLGLFGSLAADGKSFVTSVEVVKSDLWILEGLPQPRRWWR